MAITSDTLKNYLGRHVKVTFTNDFTTEGILGLIKGQGGEKDHFMVNYWNFKPTHVKDMRIF